MSGDNRPAPQVGDPKCRQPRAETGRLALVRFWSYLTDHRADGLVGDTELGGERAQALGAHEGTNRGFLGGC